MVNGRGSDSRGSGSRGSANDSDYGYGYGYDMIIDVNMDVDVDTAYTDTAIDMGMKMSMAMKTIFSRQSCHFFLAVLLIYLSAYSSSCSSIYQFIQIFCLLLTVTITTVHHPHPCHT